MMKISLRCSIGFLLLASSFSSVALTQNEMAPELKGIEIQSQRPLALKDLLGKTVLIDFWATWCAPCRQSFPYLNDLQNELKEKDFIVLAVNLDESTEEILNFTQRFPVQFLILKDVPESQRRHYDIEGVPTSYLIDKEGHVVKKFTGFKKSEFNKIKQWINTQPAS